MKMKYKWQCNLAVLAGGLALALGTTGCETDSLYEGVAIYPASIALYVGQSQVFHATGGQSYKWSFEPADGRLGMNTAVGDTVVVTALSNEAGGEASGGGEEGAEVNETGSSVITLTCRSVVAGVTYVTTNEADNFATAYISIR